MKVVLTMGMVLLLTACAIKQPGSKDTPGINDSDERIPHAGRPMQTIVGGVNFFESEEFQKIVESQNIDRAKDQLEDLFLRSAGFVSDGDVDRDAPTGHAKLILNSLGSIVKEARDGIFPQAPAGTHPQCIDAYAEKYAWHRDNDNEIPATFGKITEYMLRPVPGSDKWIGVTDLCTWVGSDNYYFNISFTDDRDNTLTLSDFPFADTIDNLPDEVTDGFSYKLHSKGMGAVVYKNVFKNSVYYPPGDPIYAELEEDCYDMFYADKPTGDKAIDLADQIGYCMGRCDGRVLNTGR